MPLSDEQKINYAGIYLLKRMDLKPEEGGLQLPVLLPPEMAALEDVVQDLYNRDLIAMTRNKERYEISKKGAALLGTLIDEAEALVEDLDDLEQEEAIAELRRRKLDVFRARFLWGWYDGEFDDLEEFQARRGLPVERMWGDYLMGDDFWDALAEDT